MTLVIEIASNAAASSWTDITNVVPWRDGKFGGQFGGTAHLAEVGTGAGFDLDDDAGTVTIPTKRVLRVTETATSPDTILQRGRISDKALARQQLLTGDAKGFDTTVDDANAQVYGIPVDGWVRPAETGRARVVALAGAFLAGSPRASTDLDAATYVPNTHTVTMPAKTYDLTDPAGVILDCATTEGKQAFVTEDDELFYDLDTSTAYAALLSITDDDPDASADEYAPGTPTGTQSGNEFFSGAKLRYGSSSSVSDVRSAAETAHDYWRTVIQDGDATSGTASQRLATMLDNQSVEELRYTCDITLPATKVDLIRKGHTVSFRSAAAGVLSPVTLRVASLYWEPVGVAVYVAHLELGVPRKLAPRVRRGTIPPVPPAPESGHGPVEPIAGSAGGGCFGLGELGTWDPFHTDPPDTPDTANSIFTLGGGAGGSVLLATTGGSVPGTGDAFENGTIMHLGTPIERHSLGTLTFDIVAGTAYASGGLSTTVTVEVNYGADTPVVEQIGLLNGVPVEHKFDMGNPWQAATTLPPLWDAGTAYVVGDVVQAFDAGPYRICIADNTNVQPEITTGWATYWSTTEPRVTLHDEMTWHVKIIATGRARIWPAGGSDPGYSNTPWGEGTTPAFEWQFFHVGLSQKGIAGATWTADWLVANLSFCYDAWVPAAYHWTVYGPVPVQEAPDGATSTFTLPTYPGTGYVLGTLVFAVDGIDQVTAQTDPVAGTGTLSWNPATGDLVTARWLVP